MSRLPALTSSPESSTALPIVPSYEPVTLSRNPSSSSPRNHAIASHASSQDERTRSHPSIDPASEPIDSPPALGASSSAMLLIPPPDSPDTRPVYHISVGQDPFLPNCFITSVVQGGREDGLHVGRFKTVIGVEAMKRNIETVCMRECEHPLSTMFTNTTTRRKGVTRRTFSWYSFNPARAVLWTTASSWPLVSPSSCSHPSEPNRILAEFVPADQLQRRGTPIAENKLTIMPAGYPYFDDILVSVLLLEKQRRMEFLLGR
ncbi:hypothetical protein BDZ97DRAFT_850887 [Flammula alnicola]|nr:hypothetical protein BDZ97DRAFT_850887 [Flammula alnicola]